MIREETPDYLSDAELHEYGLGYDQARSDIYAEIKKIISQRSAKKACGCRNK